MQNIRPLAATVLFTAMAVAIAGAGQQYPMLDRLADHVIQKFQGSTCEQLLQERLAGQGQPKPMEEQNAIAILRSDPQMRAAFIDRIAAPVANKLFECGLIP